MWMCTIPLWLFILLRSPFYLVKTCPVVVRPDQPDEVSPFTFVLYHSPVKDRSWFWQRQMYDHNVSICAQKADVGIWIESADQAGSNDIFHVRFDPIWRSLVGVCCKQSTCTIQWLTSPTRPQEAAWWTESDASDGNRSDWHWYQIRGLYSQLVEPCKEVLRRVPGHAWWMSVL